ncbi:MAG TPA: bifunctional demethylmenaquinone methyltransferase/2-methoxy-6-polyprenyl-1,4-benzoquinol methylase UbiE [Rhabdochlamydiaceae bacterium]|nr:bifunctional demethylmenaquinone methyltransferase/2-methoxy-6-polyprenyl-1,4-benzoquinol methylase UbiE [Rhabdochlamydiaceae bacterium]
MIEKNELVISKMFNQISPTYDLLNRILSFGIDRRWRKQLVSKLPQLKKLKVLDIATGTCDQLLAIMEHSSAEIHAVGIDIAEEMIKLGREKLQKKSYADQVELQIGSAAHLPFGDETFDCVTISFGIRNMEQMQVCLKEIYRVLKKEGRLLILEFSLPENRLIRNGSLFYLKSLLPKLAGWISKNKPAYSYLNQTIVSFPYGEAFCTLLKEAGFVGTRYTPLTFGVASLYQGDKRCV